MDAIQRYRKFKNMKPEASEIVQRLQQLRVNGLVVDFHTTWDYLIKCPDMTNREYWIMTEWINSIQQFKKKKVSR